jgi:tricorn protease
MGCGFYFLGKLVAAKRPFPLTVMKTTYLLLCCCLLSGAAKAQEAFFTRHPTLSPDGKMVVFAYEGDLWRASTEGQALATRLTAMDGEESHARISPDGRWVAFTSTQFGNPDVFIMPLEGGEVRRLTWHDASDEVSSWSWDAKTIYFASNRYNSISTYQVALEGGTPTRLFGHFFNRPHHVVEHPQTGELFFNDTWESDDFSSRKRYKGEFNPDVKSYHRQTGVYKQYTTHNGKDFWQTIDQNGQVYYVSDEANGEYNLYAFAGPPQDFKNPGELKKAQLTNFATSVYRPQVAANGSKVVFEKDYQLFVYETATRAARKLDIRVFRNPTLQAAQDFKVAGNVSNFAVSPDNKKLAFVSRGELFVSDPKGKFVRQMALKAGERALEVAWLSDNRTLLYTRTNDNGYQNLFALAADGKGAERQLTNEDQNNQALVLNAQRTQAAYLSGRNELRLLDLATLTSRTLLKDEFWALYPSEPSFSPDGAYLAYTPYRNFEQEIFVHHLPTGKTLNLTNTSVTESSPTWSPDGKYLYLVSNRTRPAYPYGLGEARVYRLALDRWETPYRSDKFDELFKPTEKPAEEGATSSGTSGKKPEKPANKPAEKQPVVQVVIAEAGLMERLEQIGPNFGSQSAPYLVQKDGKTTVLYLSNHDEGKTALWKTTLEPFERPKTEKVLDEYVDAIRMAEGQLYILAGGNLHKLDLGSNKAEKIDIQHTFRRSLAAEFRQMFHEAWANVEENFYDGTFHGQDWRQLRQRYAALLPHVSEREDLRVLLNDLLGELNASHLGFSSFGEEENLFYKSRGMETGLVFSETNPYQVQQVVARGPADVAGKDVRPGDVLVAVNGTRVDPKQAREYYFAQPSLDEEASLTLARGGQEHTVKLHPISTPAMRTLLYDEWMRRNQARVDSLGRKRIAYIHLKNMGTGELNRFLTEMVAEGNEREGLILDLRNNTGGNVHDEVLRFLSQRAYLQWKYRGGQLTRQSNFAPADRPMVLLVNEQSLSDAEMTAQGFKQLKLGKIIGTETYRWIIFTSGKGLVDGSFYRLPSWGCYTLDGQDLEMNGVKPDIYLKNTFKDHLNDQDPQLERAVQEVLGQLK